MANEPELPVTGWPADVLPYLTLLIEQAVSDRSISWFKIGRSNDPDGRESAYQTEYAKKHPFRGPDYFVAVYETSSIDNVMDVEQALIRAFEYKFKGLNIADNAGGNVSPEYVQYVYVALWEKRR
jgi:hypothetical protein